MGDRFDQMYQINTDMEVAQKRPREGPEDGLIIAEVGQDQPPQLKTQRLCQYWKFRITGYKIDQESIHNLLEDIGVAYGFQEEQGTGKYKMKHFGGTVDVGPSRMRWCQLAKRFQDIALEELKWPVCDYLEKQDSRAADRYVMKVETRINGPWYKGVNFEEIAKETVEPEYRLELTLRPWQLQIKDRILDMKANDRDIWWLWEPYGGLGKTTFQKWIFQEYDRTIIIGGKAADMKNCVIEYLEQQRTKDAIFKPLYPKRVIMNLPKTFNVDYYSPSGTEEVKDMFFYSGKYKGGMVSGPPPTVIIFANCRPPNIDDMAKDRWKIIRLPDGSGDDNELHEETWTE